MPPFFAYRPPGQTCCGHFWQCKHPTKNADRAEALETVLCWVLVCERRQAEAFRVMERLNLALAQLEVS